MASDLRLRVGPIVINRPFTASDAQVGDVLKRCAKSLGINTEVPAAEWGAALVEHWIDDARRRARADRLREIEAGQAATNQQQAETETQL